MLDASLSRTQPHGADLRPAEAARHERVNKDNYSVILGKRRICRAAINAATAGRIAK